jgi:hypothetical protein
MLICFNPVVLGVFVRVFRKTLKMDTPKKEKAHA